MKRVILKWKKEGFEEEEEEEVIVAFPTRLECFARFVAFLLFVGFLLGFLLGFHLPRFFIVIYDPKQKQNMERKRTQNNKKFFNVTVTLSYGVIFYCDWLLRK